VTFASAKTMTRPVLSGVSLVSTENILTLAATDSYRLSECILPVPSIPSGMSCIIPARFLDELRGVVSTLQGSLTEKIEMIEFYISTQQIEVRIGSTKLISRLIEGKFPDYKQILPKERKTTLTLKVKDLLSSIKRLHYFAKEQSNNITFSITGGVVSLTTRQTQLGRDEAIIEGGAEGEENKIALSSLYIIDFLSRLNENEVTLEILDRFHPAVFRLTGDQNILHLVMPLRITEE
jgi:DNA polymerase-3 subunit beta